MRLKEERKTTHARVTNSTLTSEPCVPLNKAIEIRSSSVSSSLSSVPSSMILDSSSSRRSHRELHVNRYCLFIELKAKVDEFAQAVKEKKKKREKTKTKSSQRGYLFLITVGVFLLALVARCACCLMQKLAVGLSSVANRTTVCFCMFVNLLPRIYSHGNM